MGVGLWPAAEGSAWEWGWRAYPGVWTVVAAALGVFFLMRRATPPEGDTETRRRLPRGYVFASGVILLWLVLDWPLGALASGYLLSAAAVQYLLITLAVAPLLLLGLPRAAPAPAPGPGQARTPGRAALWVPPLPLLGGMAFAVALFVPAVPSVVDGLRPQPAGSMAVALVWLVGGLALWWPLLRPRGRQLGYFGGIGYLFVPFLLPKAPGLAYAVSDGPIYDVYASAPRVEGLALSVAADQRLAGVLLWSAGTVLVFVSLGLLFFHWYRDERRVAEPGSLEVPADPEVVAELFAIPGAWSALERVIQGLETALPRERGGAELRCYVRERVPVGRLVVIEVHAPLDGPSAALVSARIEQDLGHYLARLPVPQRETLAAHLAFEVVPFRSRAG